MALQGKGEVGVVSVRCRLQSALTRRTPVWASCSGVPALNWTGSVLKSDLLYVCGKALGPVMVWPESSKIEWSLSNAI